MTTELILAQDAIPSAPELNNLSTQTLRTELAASISMTARHLQRLAAIWQELERRGEDLSDLRVGLAEYLPRIAAGQLDAQAVVQFAGQRLLLQKIASLPIAEQNRLALGGTVKMLAPTETGQLTEVERPARALTTTQASMVFDNGRIRTLDEQRGIVETRRMKGRGPAKPVEKGKLRYDPSIGAFRIGRHTLPTEALIGALASVYRERPLGDQETRGVPVYLTEAEHRALKINAASLGHTQVDLMRTALAIAGLLHDPHEQLAHSLE